MRCLIFLALLVAGPSHAWIVGAGASLATPSGHPLFPTLAGRPVAGWLAAFGGDAMGATWGGYHQRHPIAPGLDVAVVRAQGLLATYLIRRDAAGVETCLGHVIHEPRALPDPDAADRGLRKSGYLVRRGFLATPGARFAVDAGTFERRAAGQVERYVFVRLPGGTAAPPMFLAEVACYPAVHEAALSIWLREGRESLAAFFAARASEGSPTAEPR